MTVKMNYNPSRLARAEGSRMKQQTTGLVLLTILIVFLFIRFGIPGIVNMAVFLGDLKASNQPIGQTDSIAPSPPILDQLPIATSSATLSISGYTESLASVKLFESGNEVAQTVADDVGDFRFSELQLNDGENIFYALALDSAGNESEQSNRVSIAYDVKPPELAIISPSSGQSIYGESKRTIEIKGLTDPGADVRVNDYYAVVSADGSFASRLKLEEGENTIKISVSDEAGNQTLQEVKVNYAP